MPDGLSEKRLERIEPVLHRYVDDGELPGYLLSISRAAGKRCSLPAA